MNAGCRKKMKIKKMCFVSVLLSKRTLHPSHCFERKMSKQAIWTIRNHFKETKFKKKHSNELRCSTGLLFGKNTHL